MRSRVPHFALVSTPMSPSSRNMQSQSPPLALAEAKALLRRVEERVRKGIEEVVEALRALENDADFVASWQGEGMASEDDDLTEGVGYVPARLGGINRLLMKLDFGSWFGRRDDWEA